MGLQGEFAFAGIIALAADGDGDGVYDAGEPYYDLNGDGRPDIIVANRSSNPAKPVPCFVCLNDGKGGFPNEIPLPTQSATIIIAADLDGDGKIDLVVPHRDGGQSLIFWNDGTGKFSAAPVPVGPKESNVRAAVAADIDGDADLDLFVGFNGTPNRLYRNDRGVFTDVASTAGVADARATRAAAFGDFDGDGDAAETKARQHITEAASFIISRLINT